MFANKFKPSAGRLLLSEPFLLDPLFRRSVIILTKFDKEGAVGFILNRPLNLSLQEAVKGISGFNATLFFGGPVQKDALFYIHTLGEKIPGSFEIVRGVYWGGSYEIIKDLISRNAVRPSDFKFFAGYSGWGAGQLEKELKINSWIVAPVKAGEIMSGDAERLWGNVLKRMGSDYSFMANYPENPSLN